jgi:peptide/nickel transport system substrate-binding protein
MRRTRDSGQRHEYEQRTKTVREGTMGDNRYSFYRRRLGRRQVLKGTAATSVGAMGLVAFGCGDDDDGAATPTRPSGQTPGATTAPTSAPTATPGPGVGQFEWLQNQPNLQAQPRSGGALRYGTYIRAASLDPIRSPSFESANIYTPVYNRLFRPKYGSELQPYNPWVLDIVPDLAASSETPTAGVVTIKLKPNLKWQNKAPVNGRAFTAEDVKFTLEAFGASPEFSTAWLPIDRVEAVDPTTVRITLKQPINYLIPALAEMRVVMLAKEVADADGDFSKQAIGTGPFTLDEYTPQASAKYTKNPNYHVQGKPYVDSIEYVRYADPTAAREAYLTGQFPVGRGDGLGTADQYRTDMSRKPDGVVFKAQSRWQANVWFLGLKTDQAPFNNPNVAKALSIAFDRQAFARLTYGDLKPNILGNFSWVGYFDKEPDISAITKYDLAQARQLLQGANATNLTFQVDYANYGAALVDQLQFIQQQVKEAGITLNLVEEPVATYGAKFTQGNFPNAALGFIATVPRYQPLVMKTFLESTSGRNALKINDPKIDAAIKKLTESTNAEEQKAAYREIWTDVHSRPYLIPLMEGPVFFFHDKKVHNWLFNMYSDPAGWGLQSMFEQVWLEA